MSQWPSILDGDVASDATTALVDLRGQHSRQLSFEWLHMHSQLLYSVLSTVIERRAIVGVLSDCTAEAIAAILAIWRAGAIYLPIDAHGPTSRVCFVLQDAKPEAVFVQHMEMMATLDWEAATILGLESGTIARVQRRELRDLPDLLRQTSPSLAHECSYIMYTSGSTGMPKGVLGSRRGLIARFEWMWERYPFTSQEICAQKTALTFVDSLWEIFGPLGRRVPLIILPRTTFLQPVNLVSTLREWRVSRIVLVPSLLRMLLDCLETGSSGSTEHRDSSASPPPPPPRPSCSALPALKHLSVSGDALTLSLVERTRTLLAGTMIHNLYGSTEVSADVTCFDVPSNETACITADRALERVSPVSHARDAASLAALSLSCPRICALGQPIANAVVRLVDRDTRRTLLQRASGEKEWRLSEVPGSHRVGEIAVAGECLCLGYLNRAELTASRFIVDDGRTWFLTGDLGEIDSEGQLRFAGRVDGQLKLNGVRVESREVEAAFEAEPCLSAALVVPLMDEGDEELPSSSATRLVLCASLVETSGAMVDAQDDREHQDLANEEGLAERSGRVELLVEQSKQLTPQLRRRAEEELPPSIRPSHYLIVRRFPRLASGKLDRVAIKSALPSLMAALRANEAKAAPSQPTTQAARILCEEMFVLLEGRRRSPDPTCVDLTFKEAGGTSVLAARLSTRLRQRGWLLHPEELMQPHSCVRVLSEQMRRLDSTSSAHADDSSAFVAEETSDQQSIRTSLNGWLQASGAHSRKRISETSLDQPIGGSTEMVISSATDLSSPTASIVDPLKTASEARGDGSQMITIHSQRYDGESQLIPYPDCGPFSMCESRSDSRPSSDEQLRFVWALGRGSMILRGQRFSSQQPPLQSFVPAHSATTRRSPSAVSLHASWSVDMGKCVDASPLLACYVNGDGEQVVRAFIGSHAGKIASIDVCSGSVMWSTTLPDRVEASCALSSDGGVVFCGCYDHHLYALSAENGSQLWSHLANGMVKASACVLPSPQGDVVVGGCFGCSLFALRVSTGTQLWRGSSTGPLFATPRADQQRSRVYFADLRGCVQCFQLLWAFDSGAPIYSAPAYAMGFARTGVDDPSIRQDVGVMGKEPEAVGVGHKGIDAVGLELLEEQIYFSSQVGQLFCVRASDGALKWHQSAEVFGHSSPAVDTAVGQGQPDHKSNQYMAQVVCIGGVDGSVNLFACADGQLLAACKLQAAVFSSPVICASRVIVGSRDDRLHCFKLQTVERLKTPSNFEATDMKDAIDKNLLDDADSDSADSKLRQKVRALSRILGR